MGEPRVSSNKPNKRVYEERMARKREKKKKEVPRGTIMKKGGEGC